jgi:AAA15 family ATPase/GTPase
MYTKFVIDNFRCFKNFTIGPLSRINLITGKNGAGKTALLEAIWLNHGFHNPELGLRIDVFRGLERFRLNRFMVNLFHNFDYDEPITITGIMPDGKTKKLAITSIDQAVSNIPADNGFANGESSSSSESSISEESFKEINFKYETPSGELIESKAFIDDGKINFVKHSEAKKATAVFILSKGIENQSTLSERFSDLVIQKKEKKVIEILNIVNRDIKNLSIIYEGGSATVYADTGKSNIYPLPLLGDGLNRLLSIILAIAIAPDGIVLIDEIENGLHWKVVTKVWKALSQYAEHNNTQIFATTHSWECIESFQKALVELSQKNITAGAFRLERKKSKIQAINYTLDELEVSVKQKIEIR